MQSLISPMGGCNYTESVFVNIVAYTLVTIIKFFESEYESYCDNVPVDILALYYNVIMLPLSHDILAYYVMILRYCDNVPVQVCMTRQWSKFPPWLFHLQNATKKSFHSHCHTAEIRYGSPVLAFPYFAVNTWGLLKVRYSKNLWLRATFPQPKMLFAGVTLHARDTRVTFNLRPWMAFVHRIDSFAVHV